MIANFLSTRLNNGISYLEGLGLYSLANTLYLAKEYLKDSELESVQVISEPVENFGSFSSFSSSINSPVKITAVDYTKW